MKNELEFTEEENLEKKLKSISHHSCLAGATPFLGGCAFTAGNVILAGTAIIGHNQSMLEALTSSLIDNVSITTGVSSLFGLPLIYAELKLCKLYTNQLERLGIERSRQSGHYEI